MADIVNLLSRGSQFDPIGAIGKGQSLAANQLSLQSQRENLSQQKQLGNLNSQVKTLQSKNLQSQIDARERDQILKLDKRQREILAETMDNIAVAISNTKNKEEIVRILQNSGVKPDPIMLDPSTDFETAKQLVLGRSKQYRDIALKPEEFGQPVAGVIDGEPTFQRFGKKGTVQKVEGFSPPPKSGITLTTAGGDTVQIGGEPRGDLSKQQQNKQQEKIINATNTLARLDRIKQLVKPEYFTYQSALSAKFDRVKSKLGGKLSKEDINNIQGRRRLMNNINQEFNQYRKEITGAAAAIAELEMLKESFINEDLSYPEFISAFDEYQMKQRRALEIAQDIVKNGIPLGSKQFTNAHNEAWNNAWPGDIIEAPNGQKVRIISVDPNGDHEVELVE